MKLSDNKLIKTLNRLSTVALVFYFIFLIVLLFGSSAPKSSSSVSEFRLYNVVTAPKNPEVRTLKDWFSKSLIVSQTNLAAIDLRIKQRSQLYSWPSALYQIAQLFYLLLIGYLFTAIKLIFNELSKDKTFTSRNTYLLFGAGAAFILIPVFSWLRQDRFLNFIEHFNLNNTTYILKNGESLIGSETLVGIAILAFGLVFKAGVDMKKENESFI